MRAKHNVRDERGAFTLVEIIVVIGIIIVLATLTLLVTRSVVPQQKASRGAQEFQQWAKIAKSRALSDQAPRGIRLLGDPNNNFLIKEVQYIEQPDPYIVMQPTTPGFTPQANPISVVANPNPMGTSPSGAAAPGMAQLAMVSSPGTMDFTGGLNAQTPFDDPLWPVQGDKVNSGVITQQGDYLEVQGGGLMYRIVTVTPSALYLDRAPAPLPMGSQPTTINQYRIIRQPRVLAGETTLKLPQDVAIDPALCVPKGGANGTYTDIMFAPSGRVLNAPNVDKIILWVRDYTLDTPYQNGPVLIVISVRSGFISAQSVDTSNSPTSDLNFANDPLGRSSGL
jgi:type II secretory pathway pseudopilin PulG